MKISLNWVKEFVEVPVDAKTLKADLKALGLGAETLTAGGEDWILDLEITPNRPDCLNHYGVAREIAARYGKQLKPYAAAVKESGPHLRRSRLKYPRRISVRAIAAAWCKMFR